VEVARLRDEVNRLQQEVDTLRLQLQQAAGREQGQAEYISCLTEQLAAAGKSAVAAARAHDEQQQAVGTRAREAEESCAHYAQQLTRAEQRSEELLAEAQRAREHQQQGRQQLYTARQEASEQLRRLQGELAAAQEQQQVLHQQLLVQQQAHNQRPSEEELARVQQELASLQQQLEQEKREKKEALEVGDLSWNDASLWAGIVHCGSFSTSPSSMFREFSIFWPGLHSSKSAVLCI
jgi:hypothetical protein